MNEQLYSQTGIRIIVGSGLLWAWNDALFMSSLFPQGGAGEASEKATALIFALAVALTTLVFAKSRDLSRPFSTQAGQLAAGALGTAGSVLLILSDCLGNQLLGVVACVACALFMAVATLSWGAAYSLRGSISATPYVAGAFACAIVLDLPLFFMFPLAKGMFYALFPLVSSFVFTRIEVKERSYKAILDGGVEQGAADVLRKRPVQAIRSRLGVALAILIGYALVMVGFGYFQHLISFAPATGTGQSYGILVQIARGVCAVAMFAAILVKPQNSRILYRVGLPLMIAGCMIVAFCFGSDWFPLPAALIICGYTAFDLFIWVVFASISCTQSKNPLQTIALMRIVTGVGYTVGAGLGIGFVGFDWPFGSHASELTSFVGYAIVIAVVLLLSSEEVFALSNGYYEYRRVASSIPEEESAAEPNVTQWLDQRLGELGLTARECEVAKLLTHGRTQKWIADYLCISENTVGTHLRRIYQKANVHNRQGFLDVLAGETSASHEKRDICERP